jgi:hypothetical protein
VFWREREEMIRLCHRMTHAVGVDDDDDSDKEIMSSVGHYSDKMPWYTSSRNIFSILS